MDRNRWPQTANNPVARSLSARRAWIEIMTLAKSSSRFLVALRKESVDRNNDDFSVESGEMVALRKESVDRNIVTICIFIFVYRRSPQGERG